MAALFVCVLRSCYPCRASLTRAHCEREAANFATTYLTTMLGDIATASHAPDNCCSLIMPQPSSRVFYCRTAADLMNKNEHNIERR